MQRILVPTDGSPFAERAFPHAIALAKTSGATLLVLRSVPGDGDMMGSISPGQAEAREEAGTYLDRVVRELQGLGVQAEPRIFYTAPADAIDECVRSEQVDLVVMTTHGRGGVGRMIYGSVAGGVLAQAAAPVMLIPTHYQPPVWPADHAFKLLVAVDGSELAEDALDEAIDIAKTLGASIDLVRVVQLPQVTYFSAGEFPYGVPTAYDALQEQHELEKQDARAYLAKLTEKCNAAGITATGEVVSATPVLGIADRAEHGAASLIVMATHGRTGLARVIMGSVAGGVVQRSAVPVVLVTPNRIRRERPEMIVERASDQHALMAAPPHALQKT